MCNHISKQKISLFRSLRHKKNRYDEKLFLVEGEKSVIDTFDKFSPIAFVATADWIKSHSGLLLEKYLLEASNKDMEKISSLSSPPSVIAVYRLPKAKDISVHQSDELIVMLDEIQDPGNLGTIIRLCDWYGVKRIYASPNTADCFSAKCVQSSMGSMGRVELVYANLIDVISLNPSLPIFGLMLEGKNIYTENLPKGGFIVMGNEGNGLSKSIREIVTKKLLIPSYPPGEDTADSLNVACATAITLSEFRRKDY